MLRFLILAFGAGVGVVVPVAVVVVVAFVKKEAAQVTASDVLNGDGNVICPVACGESGSGKKLPPRWSWPASTSGTTSALVVPSPSIIRSNSS
eukprot:794776-Amphidinium_carterae.1